MKIGFVGAGKVGFSLGKYFAFNGADIGGYYSKNPDSAREAADFTGTKQYKNLHEIISDNDVLFLTVPDGEILSVWNYIKELNCIKNKIICHCSGALASDVFSDAEKLSVFGFSVHPIFAINSKKESWKKLKNAIFTIEGNSKKIDDMVFLIKNMGNSVSVIDGNSKTKYHAAAVMASNHMIALVKTAVDILCECGFSEDSALEALIPLMEGNLSNIKEVGCMQALTGPIERNDLLTVKKHLDCLSENQRTLYQNLSLVLINLAKKKHPDRNYDEIEVLLK